MKIFRSLPDDTDRVPTVLAIGKFDGFHRGHQTVLARAWAAADRLAATLTVMTFHPHPRDFFVARDHRVAPMPRVANLRDTLDALTHAGVDRVIFQRFDARFASLSALQFIDQILVARLGVNALLVGDDFRFVARRAGDLAMLARDGQRHGFDVETIPPVSGDAYGDTRVSSSAVREALADGDFLRVRRQLGRPYAISGRLTALAAQDWSADGTVCRFHGFAPSPLSRGAFAIRIEGIAAQPVNATLYVLRSASRVKAAGVTQMRVSLPRGVNFGQHQSVRVQFIAAMAERDDALNNARDDRRDNARRHIESAAS